LPVYKGFRGNPVLIDRSLFPEMMQLTGDIGCRSLFGPRPDQILKVNVEDVGILIDIDSSEDLAKFSGTNVSNVEMKDLDLKDRKAPEQQRCLIIVGSDQITFALARLGKMMNFRVTIVDPLLTRVELSETDSIVNELDLKKAGANDRCYIVVASRGRFDEEALQQAASHGACYIALVGSKKRGIEIIQRLSISEEMRKRIHCPAGLEIHAETPEEIALSVMAQIVQEDRSLARE